MRENVEKEFDQSFNQTKRMAIKLNAQPTLPHRVMRDQRSILKDLWKFIH